MYNQPRPFGLKILNPAATAKTGNFWTQGPFAKYFSISSKRWCIIFSSNTVNSTSTLFKKWHFKTCLAFPHYYRKVASMFIWPGPMFAASSFLPHSAPTWSICWSFIMAIFIFYMSPKINLIWGLILTVNALREGFQKNVKLGLLAEPPLTPPPS